MVCTRCGGRVIVEEFTDVREGIMQGTFVGGRCLNCGSIEDPIIARNRATPGTAAPGAARVRIGGRTRPSKGPTYLLAGRMMQDV